MKDRAALKAFKLSRSGDNYLADMTQFTNIDSIEGKERRKPEKYWF